MVVIIILPDGEIMSQSIAVFGIANGAFCLFSAGRRAAGAVDRLCGVAGAAAAVGAVAVGRPLTVVLMSVALSLEHRQGYFCRSHILAAVPWRIVAAGLKQRQHRAVGEVCGGFSCGICVRIAQIVAVGGVVNVVACDVINIFATSDFADIIAVENISGKIESADTTSVATAGDVADVIAIADYCRRT